MHLKRFYKTPPGWVREVNDFIEIEDPTNPGVMIKSSKLKDPTKKPGDCLNPPPLDYISVAHTGVSPEQNFSERMVKAGLTEGWISIVKGKLIFHAQPEDLVYTIKRAPGRFDIPDGKYEITHAYECVLDPKQHERMKYKGKPHDFPRKTKPEQAAK